MTGSQRRKWSGEGERDEGVVEGKEEALSGEVERYRR